MSGMLGWILVPWLVGSAAAAFDEPVAVAGGRLAGTNDERFAEVRVYKGIPFAASPVGELRWRPPRPAPPWEGVRQADAFGPACPQLPYEPDSFWARLAQIPPDEMDEDCLYLNVWTAARSAGEKRPVMVWIHGGALNRGAASLAAYDGAALAAKGAVVATVNYRLGALGYLAHPVLTAESEHGSSGNYGLLDQIQALRWVRENAAAFGGDPERVTVFGESAGATSASYLMAAPLAEGLFHRVIAQSGGHFGLMSHLDEERHGRPAAHATGEQLVKLLMGDESVTAEGLRARSAAEVLAAFEKMGLGAYTLSSGIVDGWVLPEDVYTVFDAGRQHDVPVIVGSNANEGPALWERFAPASAMALGLFAARTYGDLAPEFFKLYPAGNGEAVWDSFMESQGDGVFAWQSATWARRMVKVTSKAYLYHFTLVPPIPNADRYGAHHAAEIPYVFANLEWGYYPPRPEDLRLGEVTSGFWLRFAATGDPNGEGLPAWPSYDSGGGGAFLELGEEVKPGRDLKAKPIAFFDRHNAAQRAKP